MQNFGSYERRHYPAAMMACTYDRVDNAADPLANMERANPWAIMMARRFHKTPSSIMFHRLYKYISGVNQAGEEVFMTRPVVTLHQVRPLHAILPQVVRILEDWRTVLL